MRSLATLTAWNRAAASSAAAPECAPAAAAATTEETATRVGRRNGAADGGGDDLVTGVQSRHDLGPQDIRCAHRDGLDLGLSVDQHLDAAPAPQRAGGDGEHLAGLVDDDLD